jgi:hypothetical protein
MVRAIVAERWAPAEVAETIRTADADRAPGYLGAIVRVLSGRPTLGGVAGCARVTSPEQIPAGELTMEAIFRCRTCDGHYVRLFQGRR